MTEEYKESLKTYNSEFGFSDFGINNLDKLKLISLICFLTQKIRKNNKDTAVIEVIEKIVPDWNVGYGNFIRNISFVCESLLHDGGVMDFPPFPTFNLKTPKDMVDGIKLILNKFLPF